MLPDKRFQPTPRAWLQPAVVSFVRRTSGALAPAGRQLSARVDGRLDGQRFQMPGPFEIRADDLSGPEVAALLREHLESAALHSPPESVHALDLEALRAPDVTFWSVWRGSELVGCGALKELDASHSRDRFHGSVRPCTCPLCSSWLRAMRALRGLCPRRVQRFHDSRVGDVTAPYRARIRESLLRSSRRSKAPRASSTASSRSKSVRP